jgi:uncharacterized protein with PQ loop repeat
VCSEQCFRRESEGTTLALPAASKFFTCAQIKMFLTSFMTALALISNSFIYLQAYKIWKRQSHDDISFLLVLFNIFNASFWAYYGTTIKSLPLIVSGSLASLGFIILLYLKTTIPSRGDGWKYI